MTTSSSGACIVPLDPPEETGAGAVSEALLGFGVAFRFEGAVGALGARDDVPAAGSIATWTGTEFPNSTDALMASKEATKASFSFDKAASFTAKSSRALL